MSEIYPDTIGADAMAHGLVQSGLPESIEPDLSTVSRIYCGMSKPNGESVTDSDLQTFIDGPLSHAFPDGFTVMHAQGGWRDLSTGHTIREPSAIVEVAHGRQDSDRVLDVARAYKAQFGQQAVMVASVPVHTQFV